MALEFDIRKYNPEKNNLVDGSDALANQRDQVISFQNIRNEESVFFKAFITSFSDTYSPNFNGVEVFGRTDAIQQYKGTSRTISLSFKVPAASEGEAFENLGRAGKLIQMLYPSYDNINNALTLSEAPLVRLKVMNLLSNEHESIDDSKSDEPYSEFYSKYKTTAEPSKGILGAITSCTVNHGLESEGAFSKIDSKGEQPIAVPNTILPKLIEINVSFTPIHEKTIGFISILDEELGEIRSNNTPTFPYGVMLRNNKAKGQTPSAVLSEKQKLKDSLEEKRQAAATAQQNIDRQTARYLRAFDKTNALANAGKTKRAERANQKNLRRYSKLDDNQKKSVKELNQANTAVEEAATALSEFDFL